MYDNEEDSSIEKTDEQSDTREMWPVVCSDCSVETEVPFKPDNERPVYCRDCYRKHRPPRRRY